MTLHDKRQVAYFTMEIALEDRLPTYCGGLGVLAGDTIRSAADLKVPMVCMTLVHRKGYFVQRMDAQGQQTEESVNWKVEDILTPTNVRVAIEIEHRTVHIHAWRYDTKGVTGHIVPVYFLDTNLPENSPEDQHLTDHLYLGDRRYRLQQEMVLGVGGIQMLAALGHTEVHTIHMNEGHAALAALESFSEARKLGISHDEAVARTKNRFVFTTHTPVDAGHDRFDNGMAKHALSGAQYDALNALHLPHGTLDMTRVALDLSRYCNGVARRHGEVSRAMFPGYAIDSITNGVHSASWVSAPFAKLFDDYTPGWREDNYELRHAVRIPDDALWNAHQEAKGILLGKVAERSGMKLDPNVFTIGFARRVVGYKRATLALHHAETLKRIAEKYGRIQLVYAGKAHPDDPDGKGYLKSIFSLRKAVAPEVEIAFIPNYDLEIGLAITTGPDIWLNTPIPPREASGTSGMKSAHNGVPSLSILDGWWCEGHVENVTGWSIGEGADHGAERDDDADAASLYSQLENSVLPLYHKDRKGWISVMRHAIALNAPYFNTHRMVHEYTQRAYFPKRA